MNMHPETGSTETSLENARQLITKYGLPMLIQLVSKSPDPGGQVTTVTWVGTDGETTHQFTGFGWGYEGEAPDGLEAFFRMCHIQHRIPVDVIQRFPKNRAGVLISLVRIGWAIEYLYEGGEKLGPEFQGIEGPPVGE